MISYKINSILLIILTIFAFTGFTPRVAEEEVDIAITHVNIIPMDQEQVLKEYSIIVSKGRIKKIGPSSSVEIPRNALVIDAKDKYLIPALCDMHVHLEGDAWNIMYPPEAGYTPDEIKYEDILFMYIAHGITMVQVMSAFPEHITVRDKIHNKEMLGPRLVLSRMIDGAGQAWPPPISTWINGAEEARSAVSEIENLGYDRIKVYSFLDKDSYDTIMKTASSLSIPVDGHIPIAITLDHVLASGQKMIAHSEELMKFTDDYSPENINKLASKMTENELWMTSTLITSHNLIRLFEDPEGQLSKPGVSYLHPMGKDIAAYIYENLYKPIPESHRAHIKEGYESFQLPFVKEFHKKGGKLLTGSDVLIPPNLPGYDLHEELEELVNAGLSNYEALRASTTNSYEYLEEMDRAGTIAPGKSASLVLLNANPLEDISNTRKIEGVVHQGKWISRYEIDVRLREIEDSYKKLSRSKK